MPRIPVYEQTVQITSQGPAVLMDRRSLKEAGKTWALVGLMGKELAEVGLKINRAMHEAKQVDDMSQAMRESSMRLIDLQSEVQQDPDPSRWKERFETEGQKIFREISEGLTDQEVKAHFARHWAGKFPWMYQSVLKAARQQQIRIFSGNVESNFQDYLKMYVEADDDLQRTRHQRDFFSQLAGGERALFLTPERAEGYRQRFKQEGRLGVARREALADPFGFKVRLDEYGLNAQEKDKLTSFADRQIRRLQDETYMGYMRSILGQAGGAEGGDSALPSLEQVKGDIEVGRLNPHQGRSILAYVIGVKGNPDQKTDPKSYKEAVVRLTDPDDPLTREEFLANVESGDWKFNARTYGQFLLNIESRGTKLEKASDSAFKARLKFWRSQFGQDPRGEHAMTALGQAQAAKDAGELGNTPEEINKSVDAIFEPQHRQYLQEWGLGQFRPTPQVQQSWWGWIMGRGPGGQAGKAQSPGTNTPETVTKDGKQYRVLIINGKRMVDPRPLP